MFKITREKWKRKSKDTNFLVASLLISVVVLLCLTAFLLVTIINGESYGRVQREYRNYAGSLVLASKAVTYQVLNYVATGDDVYQLNFVEEMKQLDQLKKDALDLPERGVAVEEIAIIENIINLSDQLAALETEAIADMSNGEVEEAQKIVFGQTYNRVAEAIGPTFEVLKIVVEERISLYNTNVVKRSRQVFILTGIVALFTVLIGLKLLLNYLRMKKESNTDVLTGLLNRNGYKTEIIKLMEAQPEKFGALIFCDIDNLKFVNDCYGHVNGDRYIQAVANHLRAFEKYPSVLARPSGDEFTVYIHGFNSQEEAMKAVVGELSAMRNDYFTTTMQTEEKIRFSSGASIYPVDSDKLESLLKYSDYAMYKIKKSTKGEIGFYDKSTYDKSTFLISNQGHLDKILEEELLEFAMQPIVDAKTLKILGYEALMRPQISIVNTPFLLLELAREESKLDKLERLVFKKVFEKTAENFEALKDYKIFVNSIANQVLTVSELDHYKKEYPQVFNNLVIEVTEQEYADDDLLKMKTEIYRGYGLSIALDDYGAGYSNELSLLTHSYEIVKLDMKLVRGIDIDKKRQELVGSILKVAEFNGCSVLAEGVESAEEAKILMALGVDFMQGYYFGKPDLAIRGVNEKACQSLIQENRGQFKEKDLKQAFV